jgi:hypothetical protein
MQHIDMKKITISIFVCSAIGCSSGCFAPTGSQPMPWWPMGPVGWNKTAPLPPANPPQLRKGAINPTAQKPAPLKPSGEAINVTVGDE